MNNFWEYPVEGNIYEDGNHMKIMVYKRKLTKTGMMCYLRNKEGIFEEPYKDSWILKNLKWFAKYSSVEKGLKYL